MCHLSVSSTKPEFLTFQRKSQISNTKATRPERMDLLSSYKAERKQSADMNWIKGSVQNSGKVTETNKEGRWVQQLKLCVYNNQDEDNSLYRNAYNSDIIVIILIYYVYFVYLTNTHCFDEDFHKHQIIKVPFY